MLCIFLGRVCAFCAPCKNEITLQVICSALTLLLASHDIELRSLELLKYRITLALLVVLNPL